MNTVLASSADLKSSVRLRDIKLDDDAVELLSKLTKRQLNQADITPGVTFLAALVTMTLGVMYADGNVAASEAELLEKTIEQLVPTKGDVPVLIQLIINGIRENPIYQNPSEWLKLVKPLSTAERTLLMSFAYEMSSVDGEIASSESEYLKATASVLKIDSRHIAILENWYSGKGVQDIVTWNELQNLLNPKKFDYLGLRFVSLEAVELLSHLTGKKLSKIELTPVVVFLSALLTITWGVMLADGMQKEEEKRLLAKTIKRLIPQKNNAVREMMEILLNNIPQSDIYRNQQEWLKLAASLSEPEKMLMMSFSYEMSAADGEISTEERKYLQETANCLGIEPRYAAVLSAGFGGEGIEDIVAFEKLKLLIHPDQFQDIDENFVDAARYIIDTLEVLSF
ncbi:TerB family tellurite resistance protein [Iningainema tapete]|uniref:TerB family tellurite resistance protein n=1 Tax=Iningainema tapete BLCC-T55 TaxID=2748662 RepID=A0A8J6XEN6_9CYAN|nr:TerB family tellurite resistance protein [Iningainema tapete]MBD2774174.1 TerB family tellurite resistance protein [Iningainema tapete BLCC-T55]